MKSTREAQASRGITDTTPDRRKIVQWARDVAQHETSATGRRQVPPAAGREGGHDDACCAHPMASLGLAERMDKLPPKATRTVRRCGHGIRTACRTLEGQCARHQSGSPCPCPGGGAPRSSRRRSRCRTLGPKAPPRPPWSPCRQPRPSPCRQ